MGERRHLRIFISSPGDVVKERELARSLIKDALPVDPFIRDNATFDVISWDDPNASVAMPAHLSPQEAVNKGLPKPSECDIVVVVLWSRMGTPLPPEFTKTTGEQYCSGTEWEYENALERAKVTGKPAVLIYRRTEEPAVKLLDPELDIKRDQFRKVEQFFGQFRNPDGSLKSGSYTYATPDAFGDLLRQHLLQIIQQLLQPAKLLANSSTAPSFQGRIERFLDEYLKSETGPVPFGGRDQELAQLDAWLEDDQAAPRYLLTGPAGRGKSALLVRWVERLQRRGTLILGSSPPAGGWNLVFVPISIRFSTNAQQIFYQVLAERLAIVAGQILQQPAIDPSGFFADKVRDLLHELARSDRRVLVVVDGLDEALRGEFDPTIFPQTLPPTIRVLASARWQLGDSTSSGWRDRLNWATAVRCTAIDLDTLDTAAIGEVLVKMGAPLNVVAVDRELVRRLAELTGGEPLLLHFYATDLWRIGKGGTHITRAELDRLKPGFGAYFDHWLQAQQKAWREAGEQVNQRDVDAILMILAFAYGPLEGRDLLRLVSRFPGTNSAFLPVQLLEPLRRFIVGDGSRERGYVLNHPKIGEHLQARFRDARQQVEKIFAEWGRQVIAKVNHATDEAVETPYYLLQFYRHHLLDACAEVSDFMDLVEDGWRRAWVREQGSEEGFAGDVDAAWSVVRAKGGFADLGSQLRCILTLSSIRSLGFSMPRKLIIEAVRRNVLSVRQAVHLASFMHMRDEYVVTIGMLASKFERDAARQSELMSEALAAAKGIGDEHDRARALSRLGGHLTGERLAEALAAAKAINDEYARANALSWLAGHLTGEQLAEALAAGEAIGDRFARAHALSGLGGHLTGEQLAEALAAAKAINDEHARANALSWLAGHLTGEQLAEALAAAKAIKHEYWRVHALNEFVGYLTSEQLAEALAVAKGIGDEHARARALSGLGGHFTGEQLAEALAAAKAINDEYARANALSWLAGHLTGEQQKVVWTDALMAANASGHYGAVAEVLSEQVDHLAGDERSEALRQALAVARAESAKGVLGKLASYLTDQQFADAMATAKAINDERGRTDALCGLADHLTGENRSEALNGALLSAKAIYSGYVRAGALTEVAKYLSGDQRIDVLSQALAAAKSTAGAFFRAWALIRIADHLTDRERSEAFSEALAAAKGIGDEHDRARALSRLGGHLTGEQLAEALAAGEAIGDRFARAHALSGLGGHLTGEQLAEALEAMKTMGAHYLWPEALKALAHKLTWEQLRGVLAVVMTSDNEFVVADTLAGFADHLTNEQFADALATVMIIDDEGRRAFALTGVADHLTSEQLTDVLAGLRKMGDYHRAAGLRRLAGQLTGEHLEDALAVAKGIGDEQARARALSSLGKHLAVQQQKEAFGSLLNIGDRLTRPTLLDAMRPFSLVISEVGGERALVEFHKAIHDTAIWYP
jgi:hypothetical protein